MSDRFIGALANYNGTVVIGEHTQGAAQQRSPRNRFACPRVREAEIDYPRSGASLQEIQKYL